MKTKLKRLIASLPWIAGSSVGAVHAEEDIWQQVYDARTSYYEEHFGGFPDDILKMGNMMGVWPGGGLFVIPADKLGENLWVYTTFGLTNSDMPATTAMTDYSIETDSEGRAGQYSGTLESKEQASTAPGTAGYGYEILVIAQEDTYWPLGFLQWAVNTEITHDAGLLDRVENYGGLTVEQIQVGDDDWINVLIAKAASPMPTGTRLPNGKMDLLIATTITDEEMRWSMENGRDALLRKLLESGSGQVSIRDRDSVVR